MQTVALLLFPIICACVSPELAAPRDAGAATPWVYEPEEDVATFDPDVFGSDLSTLVAALPTIQPGPLFDAYATARAAGDELCPDENTLATDDADLTWWYGGCSTAARTHFNGVMTAWEWNGQDLSQQEVPNLSAFREGFAWVGRGFAGRIDIFDEAGTFDFSCSCQAVLADGVAADGSTARVSYARGPATWGGPGSGDTWLQMEDQRGTVLATDLVLGSGRHSPQLEATILGPGERYRGLELLLNADISRVDGALTCIAVEGTGEIWQADAGETEALTFTRSTELGGCYTCAEVQGETFCIDAAPLFESVTADE